MAEVLEEKITQVPSLLPQLSRQMQVVPLVKGQIAIYRLLEADIDDHGHQDLSGKVLKRTPGYTLAGREEIYDRLASKTVLISTKTRTKKAKTRFGEIDISDRPESVRFTSNKPDIAVRDNAPELYAYLERSNKNMSNPFRDKTVRPVFYRIDARKREQEKNERSEFKLDAMNWVMKEATFDQLKACAAKVMSLRPDLNIKTDWKNADAGIGFEIIKRELFDVAEKDPHSILKGSTKIDSVVKIQIKDAESFQVIMFADGKSAATEKRLRWFHNDEHLTDIMTVDHGTERYEALLKFFKENKDGQKHYEKMVQQMQKLLTPR